MYENSNWSSILYSETISDLELVKIKKQILNVPKFWRKRFIKDRWQMILTDKMPDEIGNQFTQFYFKSDEKRIFINVKIPTVYNNIIYKGFACYINVEYGDVSQYKEFKRVIIKENKEVEFFMKARGYITFSTIELFIEVFSYVLETKGINPNLKINYTYQYIKKWVYGEIFSIENIEIPRFIEIGSDVIEDQISLVIEAFENLPKKLQETFVKKRWKIKISNEIILKTSVYGLCSSEDKRIYIRSSSPNIKKTTYHEFGHFLDFKEGFISEQFPLQRVFEMEKEYFKNIIKNKSEYLYAIANELEYFAELFAYFMINSHDLKNVLPQSYEYMKKIIIRWM